MLCESLLDLMFKMSRDFWEQLSRLVYIYYKVCQSVGIWGKSDIVTLAKCALCKCLDIAKR